MANPFSVQNLICDGGILKVIYNDRGECKTVASEGAGFQFDTSLTIPHDIHTALPGAWTVLFGDLGNVGMTQVGGTFKNNTLDDINIKVTLQYAWMPFSTAGTSRFMYIKRKNLSTDIVLANYVASNNTDVAQLGTNTFVLKPTEYFQPWAWQNSGANAFLGLLGTDPSTNIVIPPTTITIERLFDFR